MQFIVVNQVSNQDKEFTSKKIEALSLQCVRLLKKRKLRNHKFLSRRELTVVLLPAAQMKKINMQFRRKNKPTDVLSFPSKSEDALGEILLCPAVLKKQAKAHKVSVEHELTLMLTHGILHLLGYDHEVSQTDDQVMKRNQEFVLNVKV